MGPHFWTTAVLKISRSHSDISFFHFSGTFLYPKGPFAPQPLQIAYEKIYMPLYLTNLSIVQFYLRFLDFVPFAKYASVTVTCHFWSNILRKWLLAGLSKIVPYQDIAISLWKSDFEWSSSWNECLIKEYHSKKCFLSLCDILEVV